MNVTLILKIKFKFIGYNNLSIDYIFRGAEWLCSKID